jgi:hypothetical protein
MYEGKVKGQLNMNDVIQTMKMFRNPSIYEKLISHLDIDEFGTNYPEVSLVIDSPFSIHLSRRPFPLLF